jgi:hypothetical protein
MTGYKCHKVSIYYAMLRGLTNVRDSSIFGNLPMKQSVPAEGIEPTRSCDHWILSPARLPVPPRRHEEIKLQKRSGSSSVSNWVRVEISIQPLVSLCWPHISHLTAGVPSAFGNRGVSTSLTSHKHLTASPPDPCGGKTNAVFPRRVFGSADRFGADRTSDRAGAAQE